MAKTNVKKAAKKTFTYEGGRAQVVGAYEELRRAVLSCLLFEDTFYESGSDLAARIASLVPQVEPYKVAALAREARDKMYLRHVPLFLIRELARYKGKSQSYLIETTLPDIIQRPDELTEFLALYWKDGRTPIRSAVKRGLAEAFKSFSGYQLAKYNRDEEIKLRDVMFLVHPKPEIAGQATVWKRLVDGTLEAPDTWEVALSTGKDKKATWERLLEEGKLGGLATLRNLRNMLEAKVDVRFIKRRLAQGLKKILPFQYIAAAKYASQLEEALGEAMIASLGEFEPLPGRTGILVDVSGSMADKLSKKGEMTRMDAASGLAIFLREKAEDVRVTTFSNKLVEVPARHGFALRDAINVSQPHSGTFLGAAINQLAKHWEGQVDRLVVITDEQSHDTVPSGPFMVNWMINVAPYKPGVGYGNGWNHINGFSEQIVEYIRLAEIEAGVGYPGVIVQEELVAAKKKGRR